MALATICLICGFSEHTARRYRSQDNNGVALAMDNCRQASMRTVQVLPYNICLPVQARQARPKQGCPPHHPQGITLRQLHHFHHHLVLRLRQPSCLTPPSRTSRWLQYLWRYCFRRSSCTDYHCHLPLVLLLNYPMVRYTSLY